MKLSLVSGGALALVLASPLAAQVAAQTEAATQLAAAGQAESNDDIIVTGEKTNRTPGSVFDTQVINAGRSRLYGAELELSGRPTRRLNLFVGAGYSNTRFKDSPSSAGPLFQFVPGNQFASAPHWTVSGGATWQHPGGLFANVNANYRSGYFQDVVVQPAVLPARDIAQRTLVNAKVGWQGEHLGMFLVASNIFDVTKRTQSFVDLGGRSRGVVTEPRILGISFEGRF